MCRADKWQDNQWKQNQSISNCVILNWTKSTLHNRLCLWSNLYLKTQNTHDKAHNWHTFQLDCPFSDFPFWFNKNLNIWSLTCCWYRVQFKSLSLFSILAHSSPQEVKGLPSIVLLKLVGNITGNLQRLDVLFSHSLTEIRANRCWKYIKTKQFLWSPPFTYRAVCNNVMGLWDCAGIFKIVGFFYITNKPQINLGIIPLPGFNMIERGAVRKYPLKGLSSLYTVCVRKTYTNNLPQALCATETRLDSTALLFWSKNKGSVSSC